jgi:gliding motility-associated-like protein
MQKILSTHVNCNKMKKVVFFIVISLSFYKANAQCVVEQLNYYTNDFNSNVGPEWTITGGGSPAWNGTLLGPFGPEFLSYTDNALPCHDSLVFNCTLYLQSSWDGNGNYCCGPDIFYVIADGDTIFATTFSNTGGFGNLQSYPNQYDPLNLVNNPQGSGSIGNNTYNLSFAFPHNSSSIVIQIAQPASQGAADEGWYFDYFGLQLFTCGSTITNSNASICQGSSYDFNGVSLTQSGSFQSVLISQNGCDSTVNLSLSVFPFYNQTLAPQICDGETYLFNNQPYSQEGNYVVVLPTINGCDSTFNINLIVHPSYINNITDSICQGESYTNNGMTFNQAGNYAIPLQTINGCDSTISINLIVNPIPAAPILTANQPECPGEELQLSAITAVNSEIFWQGPANFYSSNNPMSLLASNSTIGTYLAFSIVNGCVSDTSFISASILNPEDFEGRDFPNVLTPNNDFINENFNLKEIYHSCLAYELRIFNRWGFNVYLQTNDTAPFDGKTQDGMELTEGVYFYKLNYDGGQKTGFFHILR